METCKPSLRERICPLPRRVEYTEGAGLELRRGCGWAVESALEFELADTARKLLEERLEALLGPAGTGSPALTVTLGLGEAPEGAEHADQGYRLELGDGKAVLTGFGEHGLLYAAVSLRQLLTLDNSAVQIPHAIVLDWPEMKTRGHLIETRYGSDLMEEADWRALIDHFVVQKLNTLQINVYGCWCIQYDGRVSEYLYVPVKGHPELSTPVVVKYFSAKENRWVEREQLPPMFEQGFLGRLIAYGKARGVHVFPSINSYGHNTLIPSKLPELSAKDEDGTPTLTGFCTSNPQTYDFLFALYDQIIDDYLLPHGIDSFNIGLDEVWTQIALNAKDIMKERSPWCRCERCRDKAQGELFVAHAIRLIKHLKARGMRSIYMYYDMLVGYDSRSVGHLRDSFVAALEREKLTDVAVLQWWSYTDLKEMMPFQSLHPELRLRGVATPWNGYYHWVAMGNPLRNIHAHAEMASRDGAEGMLSYSGWDISYDRNHHVFAEFGWNLTGSGGIPGAVGRYIQRNFAAQADAARRAFQLIDFITERQPEVSAGADGAEIKEKGGLLVSNYTLLMNKLPYYFYSYVKKDKPYPRVFPGEPLAEIARHRREYERALCCVASMSREAEGLFERLASDARCNTAMAARFAYEAAHYLCLAEDYIALLRMMDLAASDRDDRFDAVRRLAGERRLARLNLIRRLEDAKEHYLIPSHARNQSIFMQFFADLEAYLVKNIGGAPKLTFFDMRYLESDELRNLK